MAVHPPAKELKQPCKALLSFIKRVRLVSCCLQRWRDAQADSIPAKIELEDDHGKRHPPEKVDFSLLGDLPDAERSALFALTQWCQGKLSSFLQLNLEQTAELVKILPKHLAFFLQTNRTIHLTGAMITFQGE